MYDASMDPKRRPREALVGEAVAREAIRRMYRRQAGKPVEEEGFVGLLRCVIEATYRAAVTSGMNEEDATWMRDSVMQGAEDAYVERGEAADPAVPEDESRRRFRSYLKG